MTFAAWWEINRTERHMPSFKETWEAAVALERESCAKVCEGLHYKWHWGEDDPDSGPNDCAVAIRTQEK